MFRVLKNEIVSRSNQQMTLRATIGRKRAILQWLVFFCAILPNVGRNAAAGKLGVRDTVAPDRCYMIKSSFTDGYLSIDTNDQLFSTRDIASARTFCVHTASNTVSSSNKYRMTVYDEQGENFDLRQRNGGIETTKDFTRLIKFSQRPNGSYNLKYGEKQWKDNGDKISVVEPTKCPGCKHFKFEFIDIGPNQGDQRKDNVSFRFGVQDILQENRSEDAPFKIDVLKTPRYPNGISP